ncbi:hypothetical protein [Yinghuangia sp. YIM S09857]|uniref:hypothetical protein n=1 Tax=Yinghuangia sp. YIM S09857 TaxID=3436929 RepID=UPI003F52D7B9
MKGHPVGVEYNWQRVPGDWPESKSPQELWDLFRARDLDESRPSHSVQAECSLMHLVLTTAAPDDPASSLPLFGGTLLREGAEDPMFGFVGVELFSLDPAQVQQAAEFLTQAPLGQWALDRREQIRRHVVERNMAPFFGDDWDLGLVGTVAEELVGLRAYFEAAAEAGHAVISYLDA